ncbi:MAG: efflux RND transporter periplasmic adaptor subunit [Acidaminobacteraceae bacterium]
MKEKSKKKKIIIALVIISIIAFFGVAIYLSQTGGNKEVEKIVKVENVEMMPIESNIFTNGIIVSSDRRIVKSEVSAEVKSINAELGNWVEKGDVIVSFDTRDLNRSLDSSRISLEIARIRLKELQASGNKTYDISLSNSTINLETAKKTLDNTKLLYEAGSASKQEYDNAKKAYDLANNEYIMTKRKYDGYGNESQIEINKLEISSSELNIANLEEQLKSTDVKAPISGTITNLDINLGEMIAMGSPLFVVEDTKNLKVEINISEYDINELSLGQDVKVTNEGSLKEYTGKVSYIAPAAKTLSNGQSSETIIAVEVEITDENTDFKPNYTANIEINTAKEENALVVPYESLYTNKDGEKIIFIATNEDRAKQLIAKTGIEGDLVIQILNEELNEGDRIIINPNEELSDGDLLKISGVK